MIAQPQEKRRYRFGPFCILPSERLLLHEDAPVALTPKAFDLLILLVESPGVTCWKRTWVARALLIGVDLGDPFIQAIFVGSSFLGGELEQSRSMRHSHFAAPDTVRHPRAVTSSGNQLASPLGPGKVASGATSPLFPSHPLLSVTDRNRVLPGARR